MKRFVYMIPFHIIPFIIAFYVIDWLVDDFFFGARVPLFLILTIVFSLFAPFIVTFNEIVEITRKK